MGVSLQIRSKLLEYEYKEGSYNYNSATGEIGATNRQTGTLRILYIVEAILDDGSYNLNQQNGTITFGQSGRVNDVSSATGHGGSYWTDVRGPYTYSFTSALNETKLSGSAVTVELFRVVQEYSVLGGSKTVSGGFGTISATVEYSTGTSAGVLSTTDYLNTQNDELPAWGSAVEATHGTLGVAQSVGVTKPVDRYVKVKYSCAGNGSTTEGWIFGDANNYAAIVGPDGPEVMYADVYTYTEWTPPLELARHYPTSNRVSVTFTTYTYDSDHTVKTIDYDTRTFILPDTYVPSCNLTVSDSLGYYSKYGAYVAGRSKYVVNIAADGPYGAYITKYYTTANGDIYTTSSFTTNPVTAYGDSIIRTTVTDSRGRNTTASQTLQVLEYSIPNVTALTAVRCDANGNTANDGAYIKVTFSAKVSPLNNRNECIYIVKYKKSTDSSYTEDTLTTYTNRYTVTNATHMFSAETGASYNVQVVVIDDFETRYRSATGSSGSKLLSFLSKGAGIAIGKVAELADYLDIGWLTRFRKSIFIDNSQGIYGRSNDGTYSVNMLNLDSNDNTVLCGLTIKLNAPGGVHVRGPLYITPYNSSDTSVLWTGTLYMRDDQTATLSKGVSEQVHGIVLVWSYYDYPTLHDTDFQTVYVPKELIALKAPVDMTFLLSANLGNTLATKRILVSDTAIIGTAGNDDAAIESTGGITNTSQKFVLRYVIGV